MIGIGMKLKLNETPRVFTVGKNKNIKIESRKFIINILGRIDWYDTASFYHLYKKQAPY